MGLFDWLLRRRKPKAPLTDEEAVRGAFEELARRHAYRTKKGWVRKRHIDDFRELKADSDPAKFSEDLLHLTTDTHRHRRLYGYDEEERVNLTKAKGDDAQGAEDAVRASEDAKAEFEQKGVKLTDQYYRYSERAQMGEIQETFEIGEGEEKKES